MKKQAIIYSILAIAIAAIAYFFFLQPDTEEVKVETAVVKTGDIRHVVTATGTVQPITQVEVGTQVSGVIKKIYVDYNSEVKKGQLIAELDKTTLQANVTELQAGLNSAKNELEYQQRNYGRIAKLYETKVVSETDYEQALYQLNNAKAALQQRNSELKRAKTNLSYASIYSPIDGVVLSRAVDEGQTVAASLNTPTLFTIAQDLTKMQVEASVDEADIGGVEVGQGVSFSVDAYPEDEFTGKVTQVRIEPVVESKVVTYTVIIEASNPEGKLMPGLTASTTIVTKEVNDVLTLEAKALRFQPDAAVMQAYMNGLKEVNKQVNTPAQNPDQLPVMQTGNKQESAVQVPATTKKVWVKDGSSLRPVEVKTGMSDATMVEVVDGLKAGDEVVVAMEMAGTDTPASSGTVSSTSPFMPTPPRGNNRGTR